MVDRRRMRFIAGGGIFIILASLCFAQEMDKKILNLSVNIEPYISLKVLPGLGGDNVEVRINTNMARAYRVFMVPFGPLTDQRGRVLLSEYLKFSVMGIGRGRSEIPLPTPIPLDEQLIYTSNPDGDSDTFTVMFHFQAKEKVPVGTYTLNLAYRIQTQ